MHLLFVFISILLHLSVEAKQIMVTDRTFVNDKKTYTSFKVYYETKAKALVFGIQMLPKGMYLGLAYGTGMMPGTDYVAFRGTGRKGVVMDLKQGPGYGYTRPENDTSFDYDVKYAELAGTKYDMTVWRNLTTNDPFDDFKLECGRKYNFKWVFNSKTSEINKHDKTGDWTLDLSKINCNETNTTRAERVTSKSEDADL